MLLLVHSFSPTASASAFCSGFEASAGVFDDQLAFELVKAAVIWKNNLPSGVLVSMFE